LLPCVQEGKNAEYFGESCAVAGCLACFGFPYELITRNRLRHLRAIKGSMTSDICCFMFLPCCTIAQDAREIQTAKKAGLQSGDTQVSVVAAMARC